jgi:hypothetical protein
MIQVYSFQSDRNDLMADGYASAIMEIQSSIDAKWNSLGIDEENLNTALHHAIQVQRDRLSADRHSADVAAQRQMAIDGVKTIASVGLSVIGSIAGGFSFRRAQSGLLNDVKDAASSALGSPAENGMAFANDLFNYINENGPECGHLDAATCDADRKAIHEAAQHLLDYQQFLSSLDGLQELSRLVSNLEPGVGISPEQLPTIALLRSTLDAEDSSISVQIFTEASTLDTVGTDVAQLVSLLSSKLDLLSNFYRTMLASQSIQVQLESRQQQRRLAQMRLVDAGGAQFDSCGEQDLLQKCYVQLGVLVQFSHAYEFAALTKDCFVKTCPGHAPGLLDDLARSKLTAAEYQTKLNTAYGHLVRIMQSVVQSSNNCGGACWAALDF